METKLNCEQEVDYTQLRDLLIAENWLEANEETERIMQQILGSQELRVEDIDRFPCIDLQTLDRLWVDYSNGRFGFSVQQRIYQSLGERANDWEAWEAFGDCVGWKIEGRWSWWREDLVFSLAACEGHLPCIHDFDFSLEYDQMRQFSLIQRLTDCQNKCQ